MNLNEALKYAGLSMPGNFDKLLEASKLNMSKAAVVKLASGDAGVELQGEVFGIKNDNPIVAFMLEAMGVPMDGLAIKIRSGFMQYDERSRCSSSPVIRATCQINDRRNNVHTK
ncbi:hypothetical protein [Acinetobacter sp.]|uniref:hypothetical protein n=1 Tax=Acinetobacter sp. TaxID=472 RepID=UPI00389099B3